MGLGYAFDSSSEQDALKYGERFGVEKNKIDFLQRRGAFKVLGSFAQHDFGALAHGKAGDAGADGRERDGLEFFLGSDAQGVRGGAAQTIALR